MPPFAIRLRAIAFACLVGPCLTFSASTGVAASPDTFLDDVGTTCFKAKTGKDLDPLLLRLKSLAESPSHNPYPALRFVEKWQTYLDFWNKGNKTSAYQILDQLLQDDSWLPFVERSTVLEKSHERYTRYYVDIDTHTLSDLDIAIQKLLELQRLADEPTANLQMLRTLENLRRLRDDSIPARDWNTVVDTCDKIPDNEAIPLAFREMILAYAIIGYLRLDQEYATAPGPGTSASRILDQATLLAEKKKDLRASWRLLAYSQKHRSLMTPWNQQELLSLDSCFKGNAYEKNNDLPGAVRAYLQVLRRPVSGTSLAFACERLSAIRNKSPESFLPAAPPPTIAPNSGFPPFSPPATRNPDTDPTPLYSIPKLWEKY